MPARIIDVHSHLGCSIHRAMSADGARLCALAGTAGITHSICFSLEACSGSLDLGNRYTLSEVEKYPELSALLVVHPYHREASLRWIAEAATHPKVLGIKIHPNLGNYDVLSRGMIDLLENHIAPAGLPVLSHVTNDSPTVTIASYLKLAARFPGIHFVAAHLGIGVFGPGDAAVEAWSQHPLDNVWFDLGTLRAFVNGAVETLLATVGPHRLCFGTDSPLYTPAPFVRLLETLDVDDETRENIAWRNALNAFPRLALNPLPNVSEPGV